MGTLPVGTRSHVALVIDDAAKTMSLYVDGMFRAGAATPGVSLSALNDVNNWLGRAQFTADPELNGTFHEMRIYSSARSAAQIQASFVAGPDALPAQ
jgi:hypothetical protein